MMACLPLNVTQKIAMQTATWDLWMRGWPDGLNSQEFAGFPFCLTRVGAPEIGMIYHSRVQKSAVLVRRTGITVLILLALLCEFLALGLLYGSSQAKQSGSNSPSFDVCLVPFLLQMRAVAKRSTVLDLS